MSNAALVSIICTDKVGLVSAVTGRLFDLGANLGDTSFAVLGGGAEFTSLCDLPEDVALETLEAELKELEELADATEVSVIPFDFPDVHGPSGTITHRVVVRGGDRPGLIARLCEVFVGHQANIVHLNAEKIPNGADYDYLVRFAVWIPDEHVASCINTVSNTAGELHLDCNVETV